MVKFKVKREDIVKLFSESDRKLLEWVGESDEIELEGEPLCPIKECPSSFVEEPQKIELLSVDDKHYTKDDRLKIYTNQYEISLKLNELIREHNKRL